MKEQETKVLLSSLGLKTQITKIPLFHFVLIQIWHKMHEIVNKMLFEGDKSMPEMHLKQPAITCSDCRPFNKSK